MMIAKRSFQFLFGFFLMFSVAVHANEEEVMKISAQGEEVMKINEGEEVMKISEEETHAAETHKSGPINQPEDVQAYIKHHLQDAHDFTFFTDGKSGKHYGFSLPIILWDNQSGLHFFSSSKFHHGERVVESKGSYYKYYHGKIYRTEADGKINEHNHKVSNYRPIDFSITKNIVGILLTGLLLILGFGSLAKGYKKGNAVPTGVGRVLEPLVIYVRDEIAVPNIGKGKYRKFMGYLLTVFFFVFVLNLLGLTPLGFNVTGNIAVTLSLALFTFFITQFKGNKDYWKHIFWMPGAPIPMKIILMPIEILGMFTKPFSLMVRLFANMTAGHSVLMALIALVILLKSQFTVVGSTFISLALSFFIFMIELLVAFLQAFVFTMLSALFIGVAVEEHHHEHDHEEAH